MNNSKRYNQISKIKGGLNIQDSKKIDDFFIELEKHLNVSVFSDDSLFNHYIDAFDYYLSINKNVDEIIELIDLKNLGTFYTDFKREVFPLDNVAVVYPLSLKVNQMAMFRIACTLYEDIIPELLQLALDFTIKRFPSYSAVVKSGFFWHYLETVNYVPILEKEDDIPCKPISIFIRSYRSFRVLYYKNRISIEMFHAITDGTGAMVFLKTLIREYLRLLGKDIPISDDILDINDEINEEELVNEFEKNEIESNVDNFIGSKAIQIDGKIQKVKPYQVLHFEINSDDLKQVAHKYEGSISAYILAIMFKAIKKSTSKTSGKVNIQVPVNIRKYNNSKTLRNCSMYFFASYDLKDINDTLTVTRNINKQIKEKGSKENMDKMISGSIKLIKSFTFIPLIIKVLIFKLIYGYFANSVITTTFSNLGMIKTNTQMQDYIDSFNVLIIPGEPNRTSCAMASYKDKTVLTITKINKEDIFEKEIYKQLTDEGLIVEVKGSIEYES